MAIDARWIRVGVDIFEHPLFGNEAFTKREAWLWLIANATRRKKAAVVAGKKLLLEVGDCLAARDYLAQKWSWTVPKVRAFLARLAADGMIVCRSYGRRMPVTISICKYSEYQLSKSYSDRIDIVEQPDSNQTEQTKTPLPPKGGDETRGKDFSAQRAEREARAAREVAQGRPKKPINPYRAENHNFVPEADPKTVGIGWSAEGNLEVFNGVKQDMLKLSGSEEQLQIDLLAVQSSPRLGPSMNPLMLKSRAIGVLADIVDKRRQSDRRYAEAVARRGGTPAKQPKAQSVLETWEPTRDEKVLQERFAWYVTKTDAGRSLLAKCGQEGAWKGFRAQQLDRAKAMEPAQ